MLGRQVTLVVGGAPLAARTPDLVAALAQGGWSPVVVATPSASAWLDVDLVTRLAGAPPQADFRAPEQPKRGGPPAAAVLSPATFNTVNKAAAGVADTYALAVVCEALGTRLPMLVVPMVNNKLWGHPAWSTSLAVFRGAGAVLLDVHTGAAEPAPVISGTGGEVVERFDPAWVTAQLERLVPRSV